MNRVLSPPLQCTGIDRTGTGPGHRVSRLGRSICGEGGRRPDPTLDGILFAYILSIEWGGHAIVESFLCILRHGLAWLRDLRAILLRGWALCPPLPV